MDPPRPLRQEDIPVIRSWPPYPPAFAMLDYALRDGGWIDEYSTRDATEILVFEDTEGIAGFTILSRTGDGRAEFRIALHPGRLGQGLGKALALSTLQHGFSDPALETICLIVRKNNLRAEQLYVSLGFCHCGECTEIVHGGPVEFRKMEIGRNMFCERMKA